MTPGTRLETEAMERDVADARATYIKRTNRRLSSGDEWANYTRLLRLLRLHKREVKDDHA